MQPKFYMFLLSFFVIVPFFTPTQSANAGWADTLKKVGTEMADEKAKKSGLSYTSSEAVSGIKEVLSQGTDYGTSILSSAGGFSQNSETALSLPSGLSALTSLGGDSSGLLSALNTAAENSVPETSDLIMSAISDTDITETSDLLDGGETAITQFFESQSRDSLKTMVTPVVTKSIESAGVNSYLQPLMAAQTLTGGDSTLFDPVDYVSEKTLDGMFYYMGVKEKEIRTSGAASASSLLQKLF
ncbi:DUF4197 domain-containing protein [Pseudodesulfovibrio piezophilus]|uniref:DUF4197 domain-containing protein n=1 Tax=Pseudodesulfovibrio piezophilus (strain DSM 21447 / JCM 15486 / C1TLV30) TaxID=1322246 RepID=M1WRY5_PSEP2|nr:DUF4197 domain-containing protein [Pseudodesulfovibrio piezophilus]CCH49839.1 conserved exported protein of unknown function [Pseudodesulfovibrio piezophilus C1TLV30]